MKSTENRARHVTGAGKDEGISVPLLSKNGMSTAYQPFQRFPGQLHGVKGGQPEDRQRPMQETLRLLEITDEEALDNHAMYWRTLRPKSAPSGRRRLQPYQSLPLSPPPLGPHHGLRRLPLQIFRLGLPHPQNHPLQKPNENQKTLFPLLQRHPVLATPRQVRKMCRSFHSRNHRPRRFQTYHLLPHAFQPSLLHRLGSLPHQDCPHPSSHLA